MLTDSNQPSTEGTSDKAQSGGGGMFTAPRVMISKKNLTNIPNTLNYV